MAVSILPLELWRTILEHIVCDIGLKQAIQLRLINQFFNKEILRAIAVTQTFEASVNDVLESYPTSQDVLFTACYVAQRPHTIQKRNPNRLSVFINGVLDELAAVDGGYPALSEDGDFRLQCIRTLYEECRRVRDFYSEQKQEAAESSPTRDDVLLAAIRLDCLSFVEQATRGVEINNINSDTFGMPLHAAVKSKSQAMVRLLMSRNADVNRLDGFDLALRGAAILNDKEISHILLESPTGHCRSGVAFNRCIVEAFKRQHLELGWLLIDHAQGQDIEIALTQSLRRSSRNGWTETARSLLDRGANINGTGGVFSPPPLELAAFGGHEDTVQLLLERGASPEAGSGRLGAIVGVAYSGHAGAGRKLLDAGVQLPPSAWTLLLEKAARHESGDFIRLLVERGVVDLHALDDGDLANLVVYACAYGNIDLVKFYVKHGLPVAGPLFEEHCDAQPIAFAVAYGQRDMEKALLELGATPVDLSQSSFGEGFADGSYPCAPPKMEKPREYDILY